MASIRDIPENKGKIMSVGGKNLAVVKTLKGIKAFSARCPHLGCEIEWNDNEGAWDCPCHGSCFNFDGSLKRGPARRGLDEVQIKVMDGVIDLA